MRQRLRKDRQQYEKYRQSEALMHRHGIQNKQVRDTVAGLYEPHHGMKETFRDENAYGNIAVGVNKNKDAMLVLSEKKNYNGPSVPESRKRLHMQQARRTHAPQGRFLTNLSENGDGAWAFCGKTNIPENKILPKVREYNHREHSEMLLERMPFLRLREEKRQLERLNQMRQRMREDGIKEQMLEEQQSCLRREISRQEQQERTIQQDLKFAWKKARMYAKHTDDLLFRARGIEQEQEKAPAKSSPPGQEEEKREKNQT